MEKINNLIEGLTLIKDNVNSISFYNSSGGDATFYLNSPLSEEDQETLKKLGFSYYDHGPGYNMNRVSVSFSEY